MAIFEKLAMRKRASSCIHLGPMINGIHMYQLISFPPFSLKFLVGMLRDKGEL
jgi:hypothetical protein